MKMPTPMQMKISTNIVQPIPITLPVPTVDSSAGTGVEDSGAGGDAGTGFSSPDDGGSGSNVRGS